VTTAARARELHALEPLLTPTQIAARLSTPRRPVSRQSVEHALKVTHARQGRPRTITAGHCETCRCAVTAPAPSPR
jgi:hypothetical protein